MRVLKSLHHTFFYAPNVSTQPPTFEAFYREHLENPEKYKDKDAATAQADVNDFVKAAKESIPKAAENLVEKVILIGGGSLLLMANVLLSEKFALAKNVAMFKSAYFCISIAILFAIISFVLDIINASLILSANEASNRLLELLKEYYQKIKTAEASQREGIKNKYKGLLEGAYQDFRNFSIIGLKVLQAKNLILLFAGLIFLIGFTLFLMFGWANIDVFGGNFSKFKNLRLRKLNYNPTL